MTDAYRHGKHSVTWMSRTCNASAVPHTENLKTYSNTTNPASSHQKHHDLQNISNENPETDRGRNYRSEFLRNERHVRYQFVKTYSILEPTDRSSDILFRGSTCNVLESGNGWTAPTKSDDRRQNFCPEGLDNHSAKFPTEDHPTSSPNSSHQHTDSAVDLHSASNGYYNDSGMNYIGKGSHPIAETVQMYQEEHDFVKMMASRFNINGQVQRQVPRPPTEVSSLGYGNKNLVATVPTNIAVIRSPWVSEMHYSQGLFPLPVSQCHQGIEMTSKQEEFTKLVDSNVISEELNQEDTDLGFQLEQNVQSSRDYDHSNRSFQAQQLEDRQQFSLGSNSSRVTDNGGFIGKIYVGSFPCESDVKCGASSRFVSSLAIPSRTTYSTDKFWDGSPSGPYKSTCDKQGSKSVFSIDPPTKEGLARNGRHNEGELVDHVSSQSDEVTREQIPLPTAGTDVVGNTVSGPVFSSCVQTHQVPCYEPALVNGSNSVLPVASVLVGSQSQHNDRKNIGVLPALYPMWTGVQFVTMPPMYNLSTETGTSCVSTNNYDRDEEFDNCQHQSDHKLDSTEIHDQSKLYKSYNSTKEVASLEPSEHHKTDILKSDFVSHWQNLQYGRFCQSTELHGPLHPYLDVVPLVYPRGHFTWDKTGRPPAENINLITPLMGYSPSFTPVSHNRPVGVYEHRDEIPKCRSGTGTYLPIHVR